MHAMSQQSYFFPGNIWWEYTSDTYMCVHFSTIMIKAGKGIDSYLMGYSFSGILSPQITYAHKEYCRGHAQRKSRVSEQQRIQVP